MVKILLSLCFAAVLFGLRDFFFFFFWVSFLVLRKLWRRFSTERLPPFCEVCSSHRPEYEDGLGRYCLLVRDAVYFGRALSRFIQHVRTTHRFVPSTQLIFRYTPYFGEVFFIVLFPGTVSCELLILPFFPSQFWRKLLITGRVVGVRFPVGEEGYCGCNQSPPFQWVFGINRPWRQTTTSPPCIAKAKNDLNFPHFHFPLWLKSAVHCLNTGSFSSFLVDDTKRDIYKAVWPPSVAHTKHCHRIFHSKWYRYHYL
jgi:hypothetical protein